MLKCCLIINEQIRHIVLTLFRYISATSINGRNEQGLFLENRLRFKPSNEKILFTIRTDLLQTRPFPSKETNK